MWPYTATVVNSGVRAAVKFLATVPDMPACSAAVDCWLVAVSLGNFCSWQLSLPLYQFAVVLVNQSNSGKVKFTVQGKDVQVDNAVLNPEVTDAVVIVDTGKYTYS